MTHRHWTDNKQEHVAITTGNHLRAIADHWPALLARLPAGNSHNDGQPRATNDSTRIPINPTVSHIKGIIESWTNFLARCLIDETNWTPPTRRDTPHMLRAIAVMAGHFTEHQDEALAQAIISEAAEYHALAERTAHPDGRRTIHLNIPCQDHDTSDMGERAPCPGTYTVQLIPHRDWLPDMVCNHDRTHTLSPLEWQRAQRRGTWRPEGMTRLLDSISSA